MSSWTQDELDRFGAADEIRIATARKDGTLRPPRIIWIVRVGDDLYIRSVNGRDSAWFRGTRSRHEGQISTNGLTKDVAFTDVGADTYEAVDDAYADKYRRYPSIVPSMQTDAVREASLLVVPKS